MSTWGALFAIEWTEFVVTSAPEASSGDEGDAGPVIGLLILGGAFVAGLLAIRRQRQSGRTSKFPRLG